MFTYTLDYRSTKYELGIFLEYKIMKCQIWQNVSKSAKTDTEFQEAITPELRG